MSFHEYDIKEIYSNADGTVQFIELFTNSDGQNFLQGHFIAMTGGTTYNFPNDLPPGSTVGTSVLIATQGFADLGLVTPDYIIPDGFLFLAGGQLNFSNFDFVTYSALPTGGTQSVNDSGVVGTNSPTNFAGDSASIPGNPIAGTAGADTLNGTTAKDYMVGMGGNDDLSGLGGHDTVNGGTGNDTMAGGAGNDVLIGGAGKDTVSYQSGSSSGITLNLSLAGAQATGGAGSDTLSGFERATGSGFADKLTGSNADNVLKGLAAGDTLSGRGGNDTLTGAGGADKFLFNTALDAATNVDTISDFNPANDLIRLDQTIFTQLTSGQFLPQGALRRGADATTAQDADDRIIYNSNTGDLYYDADGFGGASSAILFATLTGVPVISENDFFIIA